MTAVGESRMLVGVSINWGDSMNSANRRLGLLGGVCLAMLLSSGSAAASGQFSLIPGSAPVALPTTGSSGKSFGVGFNTFTVTSDWEDDFYENDERIGQTDSVASNLAITWARRVSETERRETSLLLGVLSTEHTGEDETYLSADANPGGAPVEMLGTQDVSGFQVGARHIRAYDFARTGRVGWVWAYSLHASLFAQDGRIETRSVGGSQARAGYDSEQVGIFLRPLLSLQPHVELAKRWRLIPFVAVGFNGWIGQESWSQDVLVYDDGTGDGVFCCEEDEVFAGFNPEVSVGFDIEIPIPFTTDKTIGIGGAFSALTADKQESFGELHLVYAFGRD